MKLQKGLAIATCCLLSSFIPQPGFIQAQVSQVPTAQPPSPTKPMLTPQAALERLFTTAQVEAAWFTPTFVAQIPMTQIQTILTSLKTELGAFQRVQPEANGYQVVFAQGSVPATIVLNEQGQISGLLFQAPRRNFSSLNEAVDAFKALPGKVSLLVLESSTPRVSLNPDQPLAVGSTFKLAVLAALQSQIRAGKRSWRDVVELQSTWKSLPSGFLHTWHEGSLLTVQSLAALMISQSDNTATDSLIYLVGRDAIAPLAPRNRPFLTTREAFILKSPKNQEWLQRYRAASEFDRQQFLPKINSLPLPTVNDFSSSPTALDIEWFFTAAELCQLMQQVKDLPLMSINPGVANVQTWQRVAYKGGSEAGVLNLTTWLEARNGKQFCVSATWNDDRSLDDTKLLTLYSSVLELLK